MDKCQHNRPIISFCIYQYCSSKQAGGCEQCMRKYHSHVGNAEYLKIEQTEKFVEKFNVENLVKPKCRQFQELVFSFFTQIKNQISQSIDIVAKSMVNKVGYPLLSNMNHLTVFKRLKNREYKKLSSKEVKKFCEESKKLDSGTITRKDRELYIEEIRQNYEVIEGFQKLMKDYDQLVKKFYKNFKHDLTNFKKIEDLKKYLNSVLKIGKIDKKQSIEKIKQIDSKTLLSNLETSPSSQINIQQNLKLADRESQNGSALSKAKKSDRVSRINKQILVSNGKDKQMKSKLFSIQKQIRSFEFDSFDQKEKEISQRKQKLMRMMNSKDKLVEKSMQNSLGKQLNSLINPPPQLSFEKSTPQKSKKNQKVQRHSDVEKKRSIENYFKVQISKNIDLIGKKSSAPLSFIKRQDSISSLKQEIFLYSKDSKNTLENQCDQKYKYALRQLPSSSSSSSQSDNFIQSYIKDAQDSNISKMTESSPAKIDLNRDRTKDTQNATDQEKSAYLYLHSLDLPINQAVKYLKASISCCPKNVSAAKYLSFVYLKNDKAKQCLDLCNDYLVLLTKFEDSQIKVDFINNKAAALNILGRYSESIMILEECLIHFEHAKMYKNLGDAYFLIGINEKCQYNYEKAVKLDSNFDQVMYNLAACLFTQGNFYGADVWIQKALEINKRNSQYLTLNSEIKKRIQKVTQQHLN